MGGLAEVQRPGNTGDEPFANAAQVIGIDLQSDRIILTAVHDECRGDAPKGFGQRDTGATVEQTVWLTGTTIYRHASFQEIFTDFSEFDAQVLTHGVVAQRLQLGGC